MPKKRKTMKDFLRKYYDLIELSSEPEIWKDVILGDNILYEVSNHGRVRRKDNKYVINPFHSYRKDKDGNFNYDRPTYLRVQLYYYENGIRKRKHVEISRLVALAFIPIPEKYITQGYNADTLEVNHIVGGSEIYNNFTSNLEWCTQKENIEKSIDTGLRHSPKGEDHHSTFLTVEDVKIICNCISNKKGVKETYDIFIKNSRTIDYKKFKPVFYNIKYKNSWRWISQYYF